MLNTTEQNAGRRKISKERRLEFKANGKVSIPDAPWKNDKPYFWADKAPTTDKRMIFCVDSSPKHYSELTTTSHAQAAHRWDATYIVLRDHSGWNGSVLWEKFRVQDYLKLGYRCLVIDNDALITEACPNIFTLLPKGYLYAVDEFAANQQHGLKKELLGAVAMNAKVLGFKGPPEDWPTYYNAGIMLLDPAHAWLFEMGAWMKNLKNSWLPEQDYFNFLLYHFRRKIKIHPAPVQMNWFNPPPGSTPWIVHAAGYHADEKYNMLSLWT